jgi:hypothetical protein
MALAVNLYEFDSGQDLCRRPKLFEIEYRASLAFDQSVLLFDDVQVLHLP